MTPLDALTKTLKRCPMHSGHQYFQDLSECPWCEIETRARVRLFNFLLIGSDSQRGYFRMADIWKEIEGVGAPRQVMTRLDTSLTVFSPSPEITEYAKNKVKRFYIALLLSGIAGLSIPIFTDFPWLLFYWCSPERLLSPSPNWISP
jgi:DNA-binding helix-hairpin-helix protein with protein kinase domain